jgi:hypothetical protein
VYLIHKAMHVGAGQQHGLLHQALDTALGRDQVWLEAIRLPADLQVRARETGGTEQRDENGGE